jgi:hypothetical protein
MNTGTGQEGSERLEVSDTPRRLKKYVGGWIDEKLSQRLQTVADAEARGNKTLILERFVVAGLEAWEKQNGKASA